MGAFAPSKLKQVQRGLSSLGLIPTYKGQIKAIDVARILVTLCLCPHSTVDRVADWIKERQREWGSDYNKNLFVVLAHLLDGRTDGVQQITFNPSIGAMVITLDKEQRIYFKGTDSRVLRIAENQVRNLIIVPGAMIKEIAQIVSGH